MDFVGHCLGDLDGLLAAARVAPEQVAPGDADDLRAAVPEILDSLRRLLARVHAGELAAVPAGGVAESVRQSWL